MQDVYQFVAKDIAPPFILSLPHPYLQLPLSDVCGSPAKSYHNHLMLVETSKDTNSFKLDLLYDSSSQDNVPLSVDTAGEKKCPFGTAIERKKYSVYVSLKRGNYSPLMCGDHSKLFTYKSLMWSLEVFF